MTTYYIDTPFRGVNLSGAEASSYDEWKKVDDPYYGEAWFKIGWMPSMESMQYFQKIGMNTIRFPISWNYLTNAANTSDPYIKWLDYRDAVHNRIREFLSSGMTVILDLHNYFRYNAEGGVAGKGVIVNESDVFVVWSLLATFFNDLAIEYNDVRKPNKLIYSIMNEPKEMKSSVVLALTNSGISAIRAVNTEITILIAGNAWSGLHSWFDKGADNDGIYSNAELFKKGNLINARNVAIDVHQYFDEESSGEGPCVISEQKTIDIIKNFAVWARANDYKAIVGEMGGSADFPACVHVINFFLDELEKSSDVFVGWTVWAGGNAWKNYKLSISPEDRWKIYNSNGKNPLICSVYNLHLTVPGENDCGDDGSGDDGSGDDGSGDDGSGDPATCENDLIICYSDLSTETNRADVCDSDLFTETNRANACDSDLSIETGRANACDIDLSAETGRANACVINLSAETGRADVCDIELVACKADLSGDCSTCYAQVASDAIIIEDLEEDIINCQTELDDCGDCDDKVNSWYKIGFFICMALIIILFIMLIYYVYKYQHNKKE